MQYSGMFEKPKMHYATRYSLLKYNLDKETETFTYVLLFFEHVAPFYQAFLHPPSISAFTVAIFFSGQVGPFVSSMDARQWRVETMSWEKVLGAPFSYTALPLFSTVCSTE